MFIKSIPYTDIFLNKSDWCKKIFVCNTSNPKLNHKTLFYIGIVVEKNKSFVCKEQNLILLHYRLKTKIVYVYFSLYTIIVMRENMDFLSSYDYCPRNRNNAKSPWKSPVFVIDWLPFMTTGWSTCIKFWITFEYVYSLKSPCYYYLYTSYKMLSTVWPTDCSSDLHTIYWEWSTCCYKYGSMCRIFS